MFILKKWFHLALYLSILSTITFAGIGEKKYSYNFSKYGFQSVVELPVYEEIGPSRSPSDVVEFSIPDPSEKYKRAKFRVVLYPVPGGLEDGPLGKNASREEKITYCNMIYLGGSQANMKSTRTRNGKEIKGHVQNTSIPLKGILESFILKMEDGSELFIGFFCSESFAKKDINPVIGTILNSIVLTEN